MKYLKIVFFNIINEVYNFFYSFIKVISEDNNEKFLIQFAKKKKSF